MVRVVVLERADMVPRGSVFFRAGYVFGVGAGLLIKGAWCLTRKGRTM